MEAIFSAVVGELAATCLSFLICKYRATPGVSQEESLQRLERALRPVAITVEEAEGRFITNGAMLSNTTLERQQQCLPPQHQANRQFPCPPGGAASGGPADVAAVLGLAFVLARLWTASPAGPQSARTSSTFSIDLDPPPADVDMPLFAAPGSPLSRGGALDSPSSAFCFGCSTQAAEILSPAPTPKVVLRQCCRARKPPPAPVAKRQSSRLAALAARTESRHHDSTAMAVKRKALLNSLSSCSSRMKKHVAKRNLLARNKLPLGTSDIRKPVDAAGLKCTSKECVDVVTISAE